MNGECERCWGEATCLCLFCHVELCARCRLLPHPEHRARWTTDGIYFPGCTLTVDVSLAIEEVERVMGYTNGPVAISSRALVW